MGMHFDITKTIVAKAIKGNWTRFDTEEFYGDVLGSLEWEGDFCNFSHVEICAKYMLTQSNGLYGISHNQIREWLAKIETIS